jgi:hypothetical protein
MTVAPSSTTFDEAAESVGAEVVYLSQTHSTRSLPTLLDGDNHLRLRQAQAAAHTRLVAADERLIHLDRPSELARSRLHRPPQLVQHRPGRLIRAETERTLQAQRTHAAGLLRHIPERLQPLRQRQPRLVENRASGRRGLPPTPTTQE